MVRTLVFHTNNVGSIPTGLKMRSGYKKFLSYKANKDRISNAELRHSLRFVSLIPPHSTAVTYEFNSESSVYRSNNWRLTFKKSYLILYWMNYLTTQSKNSNTDRKVSLALLPRRRSVYTLTKAPMAHKTNSKEQYAFNFYNFIFTTTLTSSNTFKPLNVIQLAHALYLSKTLFPVFETNLLFLKSYTLEHSIRDTNFLTAL